jgi:hypothetical protein
MTVGVSDLQYISLGIQYCLRLIPMSRAIRIIERVPTMDHWIMIIRQRRFNWTLYPWIFLWTASDSTRGTSSSFHSSLSSSMEVISEVLMNWNTSLRSNNVSTNVSLPPGRYNITIVRRRNNRHF